MLGVVWCGVWEIKWDGEGRYGEGYQSLSKMRRVFLQRGDMRCESFSGVRGCLRGCVVQNVELEL